jgi:hypothetical protein
VSGAAHYRLLAFRLGFGMFIAQAILFAICRWSGWGVNAIECRPIGLDIGLLIALFAAALLLFGAGWKRWVCFIADLVFLSLWLYWNALVASAC